MSLRIQSGFFNFKFSGDIFQILFFAFYTGFKIIRNNPKFTKTVNALQTALFSENESIRSFKAVLLTMIPTLSHFSLKLAESAFLSGLWKIPSLRMCKTAIGKGLGNFGCESTFIFSYQRGSGGGRFARSPKWVRVKWRLNHIIIQPLPRISQTNVITIISVEDLETENSHKNSHLYCCSECICTAPAQFKTWPEHNFSEMLSRSHQYSVGRAERIFCGGMVPRTSFGDTLLALTRHFALSVWS